MKIAHISDTHDRPSIVRSVRSIQCDVIVLTGDVLNNKGRCSETGGQIVPSVELKYQNSWFQPQAKKWAEAFAGRPVVYVPGNHDFIDIASHLKHYGHTNLHPITPETPYVDLMGKRFAGFRDVPWIAGEWMGETHDLKAVVDATMACDPDIIVTHAPPAGVLDGAEGYGILALSFALCYRTHRVTHHLFGHCHDSGGQIVTECGITFSNAAGHVNIITL
jgi:Icc-related predicted phosphoesterase